MQVIQKIDLKEKPSEDQASYYEESSTQVSSQILIPLIANDIYSILDLFSEFHMEYIMYEYQESHVENFACTMHASKEQHAFTMHAYHKTKRGSCTSHSIMIFSKNNFHKIIGYLNSSQTNTQFQKTNRLK